MKFKFKFPPTLLEASTTESDTGTVRLFLSLLSSRVLRLKSSSTWSKHVAVCGPTGYFQAHFLMAGSGRDIDGAWALTVRIPVSEQISKGCIGKRTRESKRSGMGGTGAGEVSRKLMDGRRVEEMAEPGDGRVASLSGVEVPKRIRRL